MPTKESLTLYGFQWTSTNAKHSVQGDGGKKMMECVYDTKPKSKINTGWCWAQENECAMRQSEIEKGSLRDEKKNPLFRKPQPFAT